MQSYAVHDELSHNLDESSQPNFFVSFSSPFALSLLPALSVSSTFVIPMNAVQSWQSSELGAEVKRTLASD